MTYNDESIISGGIKNYALKTFTWKLIDVCNQKCAYCCEGFGLEEIRSQSSFFKNESQINSYKNVLKILNFKTLGNFEVDLIGGEPTLHPHIYNITEQLTSIGNCKEISILTNLKKPISFYEEFNNKKYNKLLLCPSIHFDYYSQELLIKCIEISKFKYIKILPIIMLHDNEKHWDNMENFITSLIKHNVPYTISFINSCYDYKVNYTENFYLRFNRFKGWNCKPLRYIIKHTGEIVNACTERPISFINTDKFVVCPNNECNCDVQWNYEKHKI